jgi:K+-transporting ATPase KdpF subunit
MSPCARDCEEQMSFDYMLGAIIAVLLFGYLVYALARPERF